MELNKVFMNIYPDNQLSLSTILNNLKTLKEENIVVPFNDLSIVEINITRNSKVF